MFRNNDELWFSYCKAHVPNLLRAAKNKWSFNATTGQIKSAGALELNNEHWCWYLKNPDRKAKQKLKIKECNENSVRQKFNLINGRIHFAGSTVNQPDLCVNVEEHRILNNGNTRVGSPIIARRCMVNEFGSCDINMVSPAGENFSNSAFTGQIRPMGINSPESNICLFKRWNGYKPTLTVWFKSCDSNHTPKKFVWSYNSTSGLIASEGSRLSDPNDVYCLRLSDNTRFLDQRVRLANCDENDVLQQFDYRDGRIYSRGNSRLCGSYDYAKFEKGVNGVGVGLADFVFSTCYENVWAITDDNLNKFYF